MKTRARVVIVDDEPITRLDLKMMIEAENFEVVGQASNGFDAIEVCKEYRPDVVLMDIKMPGVDGLRASEVIRKEGYAKEIILTTAFSDKEYIEAAKQNNIYGYVVKPIVETNLLPLLHLAVQRSGEMTGLENKIETLENDLNARKIIEKAKGFIMESKDLNEEDAYSFIRKMSMDKRCSMQDIAKAIVQLYE